MSKLWLGLAAVLLVLTGCTGIPSSSAPQVVRTVGRSSTPDATETTHIAPQPEDSPHEVVSNFVLAGSDAGALHSTARQFLTTRASTGWKDNPTVILEEANTGDAVISGDTATVPVTGRRIGQLDANGIFSPTLKGMGTGDLETFNFNLVRTSIGWRIDHLQPGVLIDSQSFTRYYQPRALYFMDSTQSIVVPDLRYSPLPHGQLANWLLTELIAGPRPDLAQSVINAVPDQVAKPSVQIGNPTIVDLPGVGQLDVASRNALATQLAFTLGQVDDVEFSGGRLEITDSGKPVPIPAASGLQFPTGSFCSASTEPIALCPGAGSDGELYFLRYGSVLPANPTLAGLPNRNFSSVALRQGSAKTLQAAGLVGSSQLQIGSDQTFVSTRLPHPATSRPEWEPYSDNVLIGVGNRIYRVTSGGPAVPVSLTSDVGALPAGQIIAVRLSSDGDRVALVIQGPAGGTAWVGSVVTAGSDVRIESLTPVTPPALAVTDVAWTTSTRLALVAAEPGAEARVWPVYSDGSQLGRPLSNVHLPGPPTAIAGGQGQPTVVSVGSASSSSIWRAVSSGWKSLSGTDALEYGSNPVYAF
jgi:hypothetical protein